LHEVFHWGEMSIITHKFTLTKQNLSTLSIEATSTKKVEMFNENSTISLAIQSLASKAMKESNWIGKMKEKCLLRSSNNNVRLGCHHVEERFNSWKGKHDCFVHEFFMCNWPLKKHMNTSSFVG